ncbi:bifunctional DNA primase/polymerase [Rhodococcus sp. IEGM 1330]|uniref:bifunctional DNA primase/polymerase n=1 Tax=Rhodococcus sp. IEGM 1330 TaxID=3082225 RepID=UPI0029547D6F|nr:bifunctional DNA primase/polymerase [Rhodococcus sp. IEGM 1330]MDV8022002.1 bifunctional DNA primase/polymerase [Rhodococcus sp. IEGM 1330]
MIPTELLRRGFYVVPLAGKQATLTGTGGFRNGTRDRATIERWARRWPNCNWGAFLPGVIQLDTDPRNGGTVDGLNLPATFTVRTGSGGTHHYFRHNGTVRGKLADRDGVDIKSGSTGYVVVPPSFHPDTGHPYVIEDSSEIADLPNHLLPLVSQPAYTPQPTRINPERRIDGLVKRVSDSQGGERNAITFWALCRALERGSSNGVLEEIRAAALGTGLTEREVETCLRSAQRTTGRRTA